MDLLFQEKLFSSKWSKCIFGLKISTFDLFSISVHNIFLKLHLMKDIENWVKVTVWISRKNSIPKMREVSQFEPKINTFALKNLFIKCFWKFS